MQSKQKMMVTVALLASGAIALPVQAATILGVDAGISAWQADASGDLAGAKMDADSNLDTTVFAALEHPVPMLPNIRVASNSMKHDLTPAGTLDLDNTEAEFYYEVLDNWVSLDLGLAARKYDGTSTLFGGYIKAQFDLPLSGLGVGASITQGQNADDVKTIDSSVFVNYNVMLGLNVAAGYRQMDFKDDNVNTDLTLDGAYLSLFYHF